MLSPSRTLVALLATAALALPLMAQEQTTESYEAESDAAETTGATDPETVVVTVNGVDITLGHMILAYQTLPQQYQQLDDETLYNGILNQLVQQEALAQNFDQTLPPRVVYSLENEKRSLVAGEVVNALMNVPLDEAQIQAIYDERYGSIDAQDEYNAAHILVETEEEAIAVKQSLQEGADFTQVAREQSIGPSGPSGGDLGWFTSGMMVPPFEAATIALEPGEISDPVQTTFGWHIILLKEVRKADIPTLEDVRADIENEMRREIGNAAIDAAAADADLDVTPSDEIDLSAIRRLDLLQ
jgi:peptidyl-prolyl cis-trans isomerase C